MRLTKGKAEYKMPKDFGIVEGVALRVTGAILPIYLLSERDFMNNKSGLRGTPDRVCIRETDHKYLCFDPIPHKNYYCDVTYHVLKRI